MQQLPLDISLREAPAFETYIPGPNAEAFARVRELAAGTLREAIVYLWGERGSGRSHLLHAAARANAALTIADDVESLDAAAQQALFVAIDAARDGHGGVLAAGAKPPGSLALRDDLRTRLAWGLVYQLRPLDDAAKALHLKALAARRGLELPEEVLSYLLTRLPRDLASLHTVMEVLDKHSLARQKALTLPVVREALSACEAAGFMPRQAKRP
jgi:DnaA-homolog protein